MNDLEIELYTRGLEHIYTSVLLGEEEALSRTEQLIAVTRMLSGRDEREHFLSAELDLIEGAHRACFPEKTLRTECAPEDLRSLRFRKGSVAERVCGALFTLSGRRIFPDRFLVREENGGIYMELFCGGERVWDSAGPE